MKNNENDDKQIWNFRNIKLLKNFNIKNNENDNKKTCHMKKYTPQPGPRHTYPSACSSEQISS